MISTKIDRLCGHPHSNCLSYSRQCTFRSCLSLTNARFSFRERNFPSISLPDLIIFVWGCYIDGTIFKYYSWFANKRVTILQYKEQKKKTSEKLHFWSMGYIKCNFYRNLIHGYLILAVFLFSCLLANHLSEV